MELLERVRLSQRREAERKRIKASIDASATRIETRGAIRRSPDGGLLIHRAIEARQ